MQDRSGHCPPPMISLTFILTHSILFFPFFSVIRPISEIRILTEVATVLYSFRFSTHKIKKLTLLINYWTLTWWIVRSQILFADRKINFKYRFGLQIVRKWVRRSSRIRFRVVTADNDAAAFETGTGSITIDKSQQLNEKSNVDCDRVFWSFALESMWYVVPRKLNPLLRSLLAVITL